MAASGSDDLSPVAQVIKNGIVGLDGPWIIGAQLAMLYAAHLVPGSTVHGAHIRSQTPGRSARADRHLLLLFQERRAVHALVRDIHSAAEHASALSAAAVVSEHHGFPVSEPDKWLLRPGAWGWTSLASSRSSL
jgi:hypothetical protein